MNPDEIATALRGALMRGETKPGDELSQVALADRFGVSRIPVRDALRVLAGEGLVEMSPNRGARAISLGAADVRELYDLRILLECDALSRALDRMTRADIEIIERVRRHSDLDAATPHWSEADWAFHRALYQVAGRPRQLAMIEQLRRTCQLFIASYGSMSARKAAWLDDHRAIVACLRADDRRGCIAALKAHLEAAAAHLLARMAGTGADEGEAV